MSALLSKYIHREDGNIAMMTALVLVPVLLLIGIGIDSTRVTSAHNRLQNAADAAALSAAKAYMLQGPEEMVPQGKATFESNSSQISVFNIEEHSVRATDYETVIYESKGTIEPMFPQLFGYPKLDFSVHSEVSLETPKGLEVAIAFDTTNSFSTGTIWKNALSVVENSLENMKQFTGENEFKVSLVPFGDRVNIGTSNQNWLSGAVPNDWNGCVEPREEIQGQFNWALDDDTAANEPFLPMTEEKLEGANYFAGCPSVGITGPTDEPDDIISAVNALTPRGSGRLDQGMAWAWRVLSPKWVGKWGPSNYPATNTDDYKKKIIYLTDGNTIAYNFEMSKEADLGYNNASTVALEHMVELCRKIKADGIEIYMVQIQGNPHANSYFQQCASSASHFYNVQNGANVTVAFQDIVNELSAEMRIVR